METQAMPVLRPLRLGELLDRAVRLYRGNFLVFIGIIAVAFVPLTILQTAVSALLRSPELLESFVDSSAAPYYSIWIGIFIFLLLGLMQYILVQGIATAALTRAVADNYLGKKTGILDAYRGIGKSWPTLLVALIFVFVLTFVLLLWWVIVPCLGWFTGLGMILFLLAAVNPLIAPVVVLEESGPWSSTNDNLLQRFGNWIIRSVSAVYRAWSLTRRRFWPVLGYIFVLYLFSLLLVNGPAAIINFLLTQIELPVNDPVMKSVLTSMIEGLASLVFVLIYYPLQMTAFTLIYFDLRVRTEGFDLAILSMGASDSTALTEAMAVPAPQINERLITGSEIGNFTILTIGGGVLYAFVSFFIFAILFFFMALNFQ